ncbi:MAG: alpha-glucosidase [Anaerolineales bacterium]|uniref:glycoside hydrolase family 13 protein n=1 Tax=Candidatus Villigracilis vicinus TaxID=3140679 RepID=UPI003135B1D2|nr:alpha-glucosidase [Anaerolineales bacterium]
MKKSAPWYHTTSIYHIYPRSYKDSNGDGIGDIQGIIQKLDYIRDLGFESIWSSPFFASPQADFGYDVADFTSISPEFGSMDDALQLIDEVHKRGMRMIFDLILNHTSDQHAWFKESRSSRDNSRANWYIWRDKPNNWNSMTGGNGWHFAKERGQYYWSSFLPFQPDLNWRNPDVKKAMFDIIRFWLGKGVDGFRLDIFNTIYKDAEFRNNPFTFKLAPTPDDPSGYFQKAKFSQDQPESFELAKELRQVCEEFGDTLTVGEITAKRNIVRKFAGEEKNDGLTLAFDFEMLEFKFTAGYFRRLISDIETHFPPPFMPVYVFSNLDKRRSIHRLGNDMRKAKLLHMLQLTVRGVPCMYYGEEIGMTNLHLPFKTALDPIPHKYTFAPRFVFDLLNVTVNRDEVRTPMQWDSTKHAGFSSAEQTWLPVHPEYGNINVASENLDSASLLNTIRSLMRLRRENPALQTGTLEFLEGLPDEVFGYTRKTETETLLVLLNFGETAKEVRLKFSETAYKLSVGDEAQGESARLNGFGGLILVG